MPKIKKMEEDNDVLVYNKFSKTNQFMNRDAVVPLCQNSVRALDPIYHLKRLFSCDLPSDLLTSQPSHFLKIM